MQIEFSPTFDANPWPPLPEDRDAVFGQPRVGPQGMASLLEGQLGLAAPTISRSMRVASLVPQVLGQDGFWSRSAADDPFAAAARLIQWRDELRMNGWNATGRTPRLEQLASVTADALPGLPDRLDGLIAALNEQDTDLESVTLVGCEHGEWSPLWRQLLDALASSGVRITASPLPEVLQAGDLANSRQPGFEPAGDGSLQLLRSAGPIEAADHVAAWLDHLPDLDRTVVIGADAALDHALHKRHLPTSGSGEGGHGNVVMQLLPLALQLGWAPADPRLAMEFLLLPRNPIPAALRYKLAKALEQWPSVGSDDWQTAVEEGLAKIEDHSRRKRTGDRINILFSPTVTGSHYRVVEIDRRVEMLLEWIHAKLAAVAGGNENETGEKEADYQAAARQCHQFLDLVRVCGLDELSRLQLNRLVKDATSDTGDASMFEARAGLHFTRQPSAVVSGASRIVWWNFTRDAAESIRPLPFGGQDVAALKEAGVHLPDPGAAAERLAVQWKRPFQMAESALLLVCPRRGAGGELEYPHPAWDEVVAPLQDEEAARLVVTEPIGPVRDRAVPFLPAPVRPVQWELENGETIEPPDRFSPTSLIKLLACPIHWVLERVGWIKEGRFASLPTDALLKGKVIHRILELLTKRMKEGEGFTPASAAAAATQLFDHEAPRWAAEYFLPGHENLKSEVRHLAAESARALFATLCDSGAKIKSVETEYEGKLGDIQLHGFADLVLEKPSFVLDIKLGQAEARRNEIKSGTAVQLACYAHLVGKGKKVPGIGYFIAGGQRLLVSKAGLEHDDRVDGPPLTEIWQGIEDAATERLDELGAGRVLAACAWDESYEPPDKGELADGELTLVPPVTYCPFQALCGGCS